MNNIYIYLFFAFCLNSHAQDSCYSVIFVDTISFRLENFYIVVRHDNGKAYNILIDKKCIVNEDFKSKLKNSNLCFPLNFRPSYNVLDEKGRIVRVIFPKVKSGGMVIFNYKCGIYPLTPTFCAEERDSSQMNLQYKDLILEEY